MWPQPLVWLTGATYSRKNNKFALWSASSSASKPEWIANKDRVCGGKHGNTLTNTSSIRPSFPRPRCSLPLPPPDTVLHFLSSHFKISLLHQQIIYHRRLQTQQQGRSLPHRHHQFRSNSISPAGAASLQLPRVAGRPAGSISCVSAHRGLSLASMEKDLV